MKGQALHSTECHEQFPDFCKSCCVGLCEYCYDHVCPIDDYHIKDGALCCDVCFSCYNGAPPRIKPTHFITVKQTKKEEAPITSNRGIYDGLSMRARR